MMHQKATTKKTNTSPLVECTDCLDSQISFSAIRSSWRTTRRSNSCPENFKEFIPVCVPRRSHHSTGIIKRWHSIPTVHSNSITNSESSNGSVECNRLSNSRSSSAIISNYTSRLPSLSQRITCLFALGSLLALLLNFLQKRKGVTVFSPGIFGDVLNSAWWIPPTFGLAAIVIGLIYPKLDQLFGQQKRLHCEWSSVMRCIAMFVGINHLSAKIDFDSNVHLSLTLAMLSLGLWYFFDQSISGLVLGLAVAFIATAITQILVAMKVFGYSNPDFIYMQSWVPCLYFSGGVTIGACGRALVSFEREGMIHHHMD